MPATADWYHASMDVISRNQGRSAVGIAAYVTGERMKNTETGVWAKRNHPGDVLAFGTTVPEGAPQWLASNDNLAKAWNAAQSAETRINSQLARHFNIALSREWSVPDQVEVMEAMAEKITRRHGVMVTWAVHSPTGHGDERNAHGHLVFNMRQVGEEGFGKKARALVDMKTAKKELVWLRELIADTLNDKLAELGSEERVTHMSFRDRGIDREPTRHRGDKQNQMELQGRETEVGNENRDIEQRNRERELRDQLDEVTRELAEVEREIIAEQERVLDERYHTAEPIDIADNVPAREESAELSPKEPESSRSGAPTEKAAEPAEGHALIPTENSPEAEEEQVREAASFYTESIHDGGEVPHQYSPGESWWHSTLDTIYGYYDRVREFVVDTWHRIVDRNGPDLR